MPLQRIRASALGIEPGAEASVDAEGLNLAQGRTMLNRTVTAPTALIVARGQVGVGVADDRDDLSQGDGVLLPAGAVYSLQAREESLVLLFVLKSEGEPE